MTFRDFSEIIVYFSIYSIIGWLVEALFFSIRAKKFTNKGFFTGPFSFSYGLGFLAILFFYNFVSTNVFLLILVTAGVILLSSFLLQFSIEFIFQIRLTGGYKRGRVPVIVEIPHSYIIYLIICSVLTVLFVHPYIVSFVASIAPNITRFVSSILILVFILDFLITLKGTTTLIEKLIQLQGYLDILQLEYPEQDLRSVIQKIYESDSLTVHEQEIKDELNDFSRMPNEAKRILLAYPGIQLPKIHCQTNRIMIDLWHNNNYQLQYIWNKIKAKFKQNKEKVKETRKHTKLDFYQIIWIFTIASIIGCVMEMVLCYVMTGRIESRQGMIYGPFSEIYGFGAVLMTLVLLPLSEKNDRWVFFGSAIIGGVFEYFCSWLQETVFGTLSWEYSKQAFSIGGRTSLYLMFWWGILGVLFIKVIYPKLASIINKIPKHSGRIFAVILTIFFAYDLSISAIAVHRWSKRTEGIPASNSIESYLDKHYPDEFLEIIYPNMWFVEKDK